MKSISLIYIKILALASILFIIMHVIVYEGDVTNLSSYSLLPAFIFGTLITVIHFIYARSVGVTKNFSTHQTQVLEVNDLSLETLNKKIIANTGWRLIKADNNTLEYKNTLFSLRSFGEKIRIAKSKTSITITSYSMLRTTLVDYGVNYQNVKQVERLICIIKS